MRRMKERAKRIAGSSKSRKTTEGLSAPLLDSETPASASDIERSDLRSGSTLESHHVSEVRVSIETKSISDDSDFSSKLTQESGEDAAQSQPRIAQTKRSQLAGIICDAAVSPWKHGGGFTLRHVLQATPFNEPGVVHVDGDGVEAVPSIRGDDVKKCLQNFGFKSLVQLLPSSPSMHGDFAVSATDLKGKGRLNFETLREFLSNFSLESFGLGQNERCGLLLPNGPELALCILMCLNRYCCVPINNQQTVSEVMYSLLSFICAF